METKKTTLTVLEATPEFADVVSGSVAMPDDYPRYGKREWAMRTPAWKRLEAKMGRELVADGSPEIFDNERAAGLEVGFVVWLDQYNAISVFLNRDGTRIGYYE
jgi:hypothetical protein